MTCTLSTPAVRRVLDRLHVLSRIDDPPAKARVLAREVELGERVYGRERAELYRGAPLAIDPRVGELLYALTLARGASAVVEFGASLGCSTIYLAAALRDLGGGSLVTTELDHAKVRPLTANLEEAGLADLVEVRAGDAMRTLQGLARPVDLLFLDGWNDLYLAVLELLEPQLSDRALVIADMSENEPNLVAYREYVLDPGKRYATVEVPLDAGVVVSARVPGGGGSAPDGGG
ncbi:MAG: class I SAM-dependent methyltransferase [Actinomycetota bacterium]|nr:class I SAM-dependent methyltransferase [Actinomycetota bacterium]